MDHGKTVCRHPPAGLGEIRSGAVRCAPPPGAAGVGGGAVREHGRVESSPIRLAAGGSPCHAERQRRLGDPRIVQCLACAGHSMPELPRCQRTADAVGHWSYSSPEELSTAADGVRSVFARRSSPDRLPRREARAIGACGRARLPRCWGSRSVSRYGSGCRHGHVAGRGVRMSPGNRGDVVPEPPLRPGRGGRPRVLIPAASTAPPRPSVIAIWPIFPRGRRSADETFGAGNAVRLPLRDLVDRRSTAPRTHAPEYASATAGSSASSTHP